jgi:hypothetical protein
VCVRCVGCVAVCTLEEANRARAPLTHTPSNAAPRSKKRSSIHPSRPGRAGARGPRLAVMMAKSVCRRWAVVGGRDGDGGGGGGAGAWVSPRNLAKKSLMSCVVVASRPAQPPAPACLSSSPATHTHTIPPQGQTCIPLNPLAPQFQKQALARSKSIAEPRPPPAARSRSTQP